MSEPKFEHGFFIAGARWGKLTEVTLDHRYSRPLPFSFGREEMMKMAICSSAAQLRLNDLISKVAHVRIKDTLRVLVALRAVAEQYDLSVEEILDLPRSAQKPTADQARECERAYIGMYENARLNNLLFELEQFI